MQILVVENWPRTTLGLIGTALDEAGAESHIVQAHRGDALPLADGFDALILLGGAQDALDDTHYPYLRDQVGLVHAFAQEDRAVLGVCLGAQIVARACGAENLLGRPVEFGWHKVRTTEAGRADPVLSAIGKSAPLFHWHSDTFTLPPQSLHLAASERTPNQAFRVGRAVYGIQFHFEAGTELVAEWSELCADEIGDVDPGWRARHLLEAERHGAAANSAGLALARAWVARAAAKAHGSGT